MQSRDGAWATGKQQKMTKQKTTFRVATEGQHKFVTRDMAALNFLLYIPMEHQDERIQMARTIKGLYREEEQSDSTHFETERPVLPWWRRLSTYVVWWFWTLLIRSDATEEVILDTQEEESDDGFIQTGEVWERNVTRQKPPKPLDNPLADGMDLGPSLDARNISTQGRKLDGPEATSVALPPHFRRRITKESGAKVLQWELEVVHLPMMERSRLFFSCSNSYPLCTSSFIRYDPSEEENRRRRQKLMDQQSASIFKIPKRDWRGSSFAQLLPAGRERLLLEKEPSSLPLDVSSEGGGTKVKAKEDDDDDDDNYEPGELDDPSMGQGKYSQVIRGDDTLGPIVCSILKHATMSDLKDELNNKWRERHLEQPSSLSLSKIRNLKSEALGVCHRTDIEVATVAYACIYFERICMQRVVTKANRRLTFATCLVLAYKFNEPIFIGGSDPRLKALFDFFDSEWSITPEQVFDAELGLMVKLKFRLHARGAHLTHHFQRLLKAGFINLSARAYLADEDMFDSWANSPQWLANHEPGEPLTRRPMNEHVVSSPATVDAGLPSHPRSRQTWWRQPWEPKQSPLQQSAVSSSAPTLVSKGPVVSALLSEIRARSTNIVKSQ